MSAAIDHEIIGAVLQAGVVGLLVLCLGLPGTVQEEGGDKRVDQAIDLIASANYLEAAEKLESHLEKQPADAEAWYLLGRCRNRLELYEEAYAALLNAGSYGAQTPDLNREIGFALQGLKRWPAALQYLRKAETDDPEAWMARAQIQLKQKNYQKAKQAIQRVLELADRLDAPAYLLRARLRALEGKPSLARKDIKRGLSLVRTSSMKASYKKLGTLLESLDEHVFRLYAGIFYREKVNEKKGIVERTRRDAALRKRIASALEAFREQVDESDRSPERFRQFVRERDEHAQTESVFKNLHKLFDRLKSLDLSEKQMANLRLMIVGSITPDGTTSEFLVKTIQVGE